MNFFLWPLWTKICGQNQIMLCDHSNETTLAVFSRGTFYFSAFVQSEILEFCGNFYFVRLWQCEVDNQVDELICARCRSFPWTHLPKKLFNMCFSEGRFFVSFATFTETIMHLGPPPPAPHKKNLHNHCFQFLLGVTVVPREIQDNATF